MNSKLLHFLEDREFPVPPETYVPGTPLALYEFRSGAHPAEDGAVLLDIDGDFLTARGLFSDHDLYNETRRDNDTTWLFGDTFELMFQIRGHEDYYEFHSTPEGFRLQLHIRDYRTIRSVPHEQKVCEAGLQVRNRIDPERHLWESELRIPFYGIGLDRDPLDGSRFVIVRQNHTHGKPAPEITATRSFPVTAHTPYLWHTIKI